MTQSRFVALPPKQVATSRLAWRISRAILSRDRGWSLDTVSVSRRWRFQVGRSRWIAHAFISFFFHAWALRRRGTAVYSINFEGKGSASDLAGSAHVQEVRARLGAHHASATGARLEWTLPNESRPGRLLSEMDMIAQAFGTNDPHRAPRSTSRTPTKRLAVLAEAVLAHGTWNLEGAGVWLWRDQVACGAISPILTSYRGRPELSSMLSISNAEPLGANSACLARAEARGYVDSAGKEHAALSLMKLQPLSLRAALTEARFIETEVLDKRHASDDPERTRPTA